MALVRVQPGALTVLFETHGLSVLTYHLKEFRQRPSYAQYVARIQKTKNTVIPTWKVSWQDTDMSRSKAIGSYGDALRFKALVEESGDQMPAIGVLDEHGLIQYADWIHPGVPVALLKMLDATPSEEEALRRVRAMLKLIVEVPR